MTRPATPDGYIWRGLTTDPPTEDDLPVLVQYGDSGMSVHFAALPRPCNGRCQWAPLIVPAAPPRTVTVTIDVDLDDPGNTGLRPEIFISPAIRSLAAAFRDALDSEAE